MWLFILEAFAALLLFVFIIWWTMFSGRRQGELPPDETGLDADQDDDRGGNKKLKG